MLTPRVRFRLWWRRAWHDLAGHTVCRFLGHHWTRKLSGWLCARCVTFTHHRY